MPAKITAIPFPDPNPSGLCACGCGGLATVVTHTRQSKGEYAGHHHRFITGHNMRSPSRDLYEVRDCGYKTPCWVWLRSVNGSHGYGTHVVEGRSVAAHKWMYEQRYGPVPDGLDLDHLCRNRACVNPDHLEPVTRAVNAWRGAKTKLTPDLVRLIRSLSPDLSGAEIARRLELRPDTVRNVINRKRWASLP